MSMKYNAFLYDFDNRPFLKEEVRFYRRFVKEHNIRTYLEYGVGTGRIFSVLAPKCEYAVGVDLSNEMLKVCREKVKHLSNCELIYGDFLNYRSDRVFDLLAIPFNSFHHILTKKDQIKFLRTVKKSMGDKSLFMLDTVNYSVAQPLIGTVNEWKLDYTCNKKELQVVRTQMLTRRNYKMKTLEKIFKYEIFKQGIRIKEESFVAKMKFSEYSDIEALLKKVGLEIVKVFSKYEDNESVDGRKAIYLIKKKHV